MHSLAVCALVVLVLAVLVLVLPGGSSGNGPEIIEHDVRWC